MSEFLKLMDHLSGEKKEKLQKLFTNAPYWLIDSFQVINLEKNTTFVTRGEEANAVYVLVSGNVKATDERIYDVAYDYTWFEPIEIFGAMELYMGYDRYIATLITLTKCQLLGISRGLYKKWIMGDSAMMLEQVRDITRKLNDQALKERDFQFLDSSERISYLLLQMYRRYAVDGVCTIRLTRDAMAKQCGINVRTVGRALRKLLDADMLCRSGHYMTINEQQYQKIKEMLSKETIIDGGYNDERKEKNNSGL